MPDAIGARGVAVRLGRRHVLRGVDVRARRGALTAILGPNGAGKTTLLKALLGLVPLAAGEVCVDGVSLARMSRLERARRLGYVPQRSRLDAPMPARDVVALGRFAAATGHRGDDPVVERALRRVGAVHLADRPFSRLSGGEQRLVTLARALAAGARTVLLDEPTSSLDVAHRLRVCELMRELAAADIAVVCVLHELDDARRYADDVVVLQDGQVAGSGVTAEVVSRVYGVELRERDALGFRRPAGRQ